jgi:hypothetical protein
VSRENRRFSARPFRVAPASFEREVGPHTLGPFRIVFKVKGLLNFDCWKLLKRKSEQAALAGKLKGIL